MNSGSLFTQCESPISLHKGVLINIIVIQQAPVSHFHILAVPLYDLPCQWLSNYFKQL